eukprot:COSAG01_NODE_1762_length_9295_cov_7.745134_1_plen_332_part_10
MTGHWSAVGSTFSCQQNTNAANSCVAPQGVSGGQWDLPTGTSGSYPLNSVATLNCGPGYTESPSQSLLTCNAGGTWTGNAVGTDGSVIATCTVTPPLPPEVCSNPLPIITSGRWEPAPAGGFVVGSDAHLTCDGGYTEQPTGAYASCTRAFLDGEWTGPGMTATCVIQQQPTAGMCTNPVSVIGGSWSAAIFGYHEGDTVNLTCSGDRTANPPSAALTCGPMGVWTGSIHASCIASPPPPVVVCAPPATVTNGQWSLAPAGGFVPSTVTRLNCGGFTEYCTSGSSAAAPCTDSLLTCSPSGQWCYGSAVTPCSPLPTFTCQAAPPVSPNQCT